MIVFMVRPPSTVQPLRRRPRPTPSFLEPTAPSGFDIFAENYARGNQRRVDDMVKYGGETSGLGSRIADQFVSRGVVSDNPVLRAGALAGDILLDPGSLVPGAAAVKGVQTAGRVAQLAPDTRQLYLNSLLGRLYHGSKDGELPALLNNRGPQPRNWFQADTFLTTSRPLARTYASGDLYRARVPLDVAENMNVMDIYNDSDRLLEIANSPRIGEILGREGANVVRHKSGQGMPLANYYRVYRNPFTNKLSRIAEKDVEKPVYAFTEPQGIKMKRLSDPLSGVSENLNDFSYRVQAEIQSLIDRIRKTGDFDPDNVL